MWNTCLIPERSAYTELIARAWPGHPRPSYRVSPHISVLQWFFVILATWVWLYRRRWRRRITAYFLHFFLIRHVRWMIYRYGLFGHIRSITLSFWSMELSRRRVPHRLAHSNGKIFGCPYNFRDSPWLRPRVLFPTFSRAFFPIDPMNVPTKFEVRSFACSEIRGSS